MNTTTLFTAVRLGAVEAPNRLVMSPLTRMRAGPRRVPTPLMAEYYLQRANPDLPERFRLHAPLNTPDASTFYGGAEKGYTDYPALSARVGLEREYV